MRRARAEWERRIGLSTFLDRYPDFAVRPEAGGGLRLVGYLERVFTADELEDLMGGFELEIRIPRRFPDVVLSVFERDRRIPRDYHKLDGGSFCLGSGLRLALAMHASSDLTRFFDTFVIPYLYRFLYWEKHGEKRAKETWPDLDHGAPGLLVDYARILRATSPEMCAACVKLLSKKKRIANKKPCPCGSGQRLGRCHNRALNVLRSVRPRSWFGAEHQYLEAYLEGEKRRKSVPAWSPKGGSRIMRIAASL